MKAKRCLVRLAILVLALGSCAALTALVYNVPYVHDRLEWRLIQLRADIRYTLFPPQNIVFTPNPTVAAMVQSTLAAFTPPSSPTATPGPTATPTITPTPTIEPTFIPSRVELGGIRYEHQLWNNCGPANLSMALSFWGWQGSQNDTAAVLKPNPRDKNVMPYEMEAFVEEHTGLQAVVRVGGDLDTLRRFIAAGFPVLIEKGFDVPRLGWMGHYQVLAGYDDAIQEFSAYDSYEHIEGGYYEGHTLPVPYSIVETYWRHFNYVYIVIYPPNREAEVMALLGPDADESANYQHAAQRASDDIVMMTGRDLYFAWFNRGTNLVRLQDYAGAAAAYDEAFQVYPQIPEDERPWRMLWYQTGPYFAYYYSGRYYDVINLATVTLGAMDEPILEESYYWRALAREALGDVSGAIEDLHTSLGYHPGFGPSLAVLDRLDVAP